MYPPREPLFSWIVNTAVRVVKTIVIAVILSVCCLYLFKLNRSVVSSNSPHSKAIGQCEDPPFDQTVDSQDDNDEHFIIWKVECEKISDNVTLHKAYKTNEKKSKQAYLKEKLNGKEWKFCYAESANLLEEVLKTSPWNSDFHKADFDLQLEARIEQEWPFKNFGHFGCVESIGLKFYGLEMLLVYYRSFVHVEEPHSCQYKDYKSFTSETTNKVLHHFCYLQKTRLFRVKRETNETVLISEADSLDLTGLKDVLEGRWHKLVKLEDFSKVFTDVVHHKQNWKNIGPEELSKKFQFGSVLMVKRSLRFLIPLRYYHAGVYLDGEKIFHAQVAQEKLREPQKLLRYELFKDFVGSDEEILEHRMLIPKYNKSEIYNRARERKDQYFNYNLVTANCEHFAYEFVTDVKFSSQTDGFGIFRKLVAHIFNYGSFAVLN